MTRSHHGVVIHVEHLPNNERAGVDARGVDAGQSTNGEMVPAQIMGSELFEIKRGKQSITCATVEVHLFFRVIFVGGAPYLTQNLTWTRNI